MTWWLGGHLRRPKAAQDARCRDCGHSPHYAGCQERLPGRRSPWQPAWRPAGRPCLCMTATTWSRRSNRPNKCRRRSVVQHVQSNRDRGRW